MRALRTYKSKEQLLSRPESENTTTVSSTSISSPHCLSPVPRNKWFRELIATQWFTPFSSAIEEMVQFCFSVHIHKEYVIIVSGLKVEPSSGRIDTAIWMHSMDSNKTAGEEVRRQLHKNAASNLEQVLAATPHKIPTVRPPASYHENYSS